MRKGNRSVGNGSMGSGSVGSGRLGVASRGVASSDKTSSDKTWSENVARLMSREGLTREKARDQLIVEGLKRGDTGALAAMLIDGHVPAPNVRLLLALMLLENDAAEEAIAAHQVDPDRWWVPHRLVAKPRPARPRHVRAPIGHSAHSARLMPDVGYQAAIDRLDEAVRATDGADGEPPAGKRAAPKRRPPPKPKKG